MNVPTISTKQSYLIRFLIRGAASLALYCIAGCQRPAADTVPAPPPAWFRDATEEVGLNFTHDAGPVSRYFMPQIMGSGAALFDFDNDGKLDIYLVNNGGPGSRAVNRLYRQETDGRFKDVSAGSGLDIAGYGMGVAVGDVNNDGWPDVVVTEYGGTRLLLNEGNGTFREATKDAGIDNPLWGTSACFLDYDRDGWLDLVVVNYVEYDPARTCTDPLGQQDYCFPQLFASSIAKLYRNRTGDGKGVRFEDVTLASGLGKAPGPGLGVLAADFDSDGWPDIFVANDKKPNRLWINQHNGTFVDEAVQRGLAYDSLGQAGAGMGIALGDVDNDGLFDLFVDHLADETNTLWKQGPRGLFRDRTGPAGLVHSRWRGTGFGTAFIDFDQDGALDLAVANGGIARMRFAPAAANPALGPHWSRYAERNQLFANDGMGRFRDISEEQPVFCGTSGVFRGLAWGDVNGDGAVDLLITAVAAPARLYFNVVPQPGHWLLIRAIDPALKRDAYGAEVGVRAGERRWIGWINPGSSYLCSNDPRAHFGLGKSERVDAIEILWPDGVREFFPGSPTDRALTLRRGEGERRERIQ